MYLCWYGVAAGTRGLREGGIVLGTTKHRQLQNSSRLPYIIMCENNLIQFIQAQDEGSELELGKRGESSRIER